MRDSIVFYRSFYEAIKELPDEEAMKCFRAIMDYGLDGTEPEAGGVAKAVFLMAKPQIDVNNKRYQNGTKGGRPKTKEKLNGNQTETKNEPNNNQIVIKPEPNVNVNENVNENVKENEKDKNKNIVRFTPPDVEMVRDYCIERNNNVDPQAFIDFYESKGWMIGKNRMKSWKAAVRTWERSRQEPSQVAHGAPGASCETNLFDEWRDA